MAVGNITLSSHELLFLKLAPAMMWEDKNRFSSYTIKGKHFHLNFILFFVFFFNKVFLLLFHFQIIYFVCERLLELAGRGNSLSSTFAKRSVDLKGAESDLSSLQLESKSKNRNQEGSSSADTFPSISTKNVFPSRLDGDKAFNNAPSDKECEKENESVILNGNGDEAKLNERDPCADNLQDWWKQMTETEVTCLKAQEIAIALCNSAFNDDVIKRKNELKVCPLSSSCNYSHHQFFSLRFLFPSLLH